MLGNEAGAPPIVTLLYAIQEVTLSTWSETCLNTFIRSLETQEPACITFFTYLTKYVEYNRSRYQSMKEAVIRIRTELNALKREVANALNTTDFNLRQSAPQASGVSDTPQVAAPTAPSASSTPYLAVPTAPSAGLPSYIAAPPASGIARPSSAGPAASSDGTFVCRMGIAGNNVWVTFPGNDEIASRKAKLFGSSAKMDTFTGQDISSFPEWVAQFLSGVNLYQPSEPQACRVALHLLRGKAAEMAKNISQQHTMRDHKELLEQPDQMSIIKSTN